MVTTTTITTTVTKTTTKAAATTTTTMTMTDDDNDGRYGGWDVHHRVRKGRRHDNGTTHNNKIDHR